jgi:hypothetical protein
MERENLRTTQENVVGVAAGIRTEFLCNTSQRCCCTELIGTPDIEKEASLLCSQEPGNRHYLMSRIISHPHTLFL